jgi:ribosome modulation factor
MGYEKVGEANRKRKTARRHYSRRYGPTWSRGFGAARRGESRDVCPYTHHKAQAFRDAWLAGWRAGRVGANRRRSANPGEK